MTLTLMVILFCTFLKTTEGGVCGALLCSGSDQLLLQTEGIRRLWPYPEVSCAPFLVSPRLGANDLEKPEAGLLMKGNSTRVYVVTG